MDHWSHGPLVHWTIGPLVHWSIGTLEHWTIGPLDHWTIGTLVHWFIGSLVLWSIGPLVDCQMSKVNKVKFLSERTSGVPPVIFPIPILSVSYLNLILILSWPWSYFDDNPYLSYILSYINVIVLTTPRPDICTFTLNLFTFHRFGALLWSPV